MNKKKIYLFFTLVQEVRLKKKKKKEKNVEFIHLINCKPEIIAISETKINLNSTNFLISQYLLHVDSKTNAGGMSLHIKQNIRFNVRHDLTVQVEKCENLWIETEQKSLLSLGLFTDILHINLRLLKTTLWIY